MTDVRPSVLMAFACESVTHEPNAPVSFQNIMEGVTAADFPAPTARWCAVFCFFSPVPLTMANCRVLIEHERGELIAQRQLRDLRFTAENDISRNVVSFQGIAWPYPGRYFVKFVGGQDTVLAFFPLVVQHVEIPADEPAEASPA
jgi:hypothetical protein